MSDRSDEELAEVADELAEELRALREDLDRERNRRTPLGLPRPPRPREVLRLADQFAIPALISILEANIKLLEGLQAVLRLANPEREARERGREATSTAADAGRKTMERLQDALDDLGSAIESGAFPDDRAGGDVLDDVEELQNEIEDRLDSARAEREAVTDPQESDQVEEPDDDMDDGVEIDIDAELDSLRERYSEDPDAPDSSPDDAGDEDGG